MSFYARAQNFKNAEKKQCKLCIAQNDNESQKETANRISLHEGVKILE